MTNVTDIFSTFDAWDRPHTERHLVLIPGYDVSPLNFDVSVTSLPTDINSHPFSKFTAAFVRDHRLGVTKTPIRQPFLPKQTAQDNKDSVTVFNHVLRYMYEPTLSDEKRELVGAYIIQQGLSHEGLRDEIYLQLCNQTMGDIRRTELQTERAWQLLAQCLCAFPPSAHLAKYLLKYVSDCRDNGGYSTVCQYKLLQLLTPHFCRVYPPTMLEREAVKRKGCIALAANFSDGEKLFCQIESWTTAELFASSLLRTRNVSESAARGWTVILRDGRDSFECSGVDYVLDLIGEIEVPPSFPCNSAYFLTMTDASKPARQTYADQPHTADRLRLMPLEVDEIADSFLVPSAVKIRQPMEPAHSEVIPITPRQAVPIVPPLALSPMTSPRQPATSPPRQAPAPAPAKRTSLIKPEDVYAAKNDALSPISALNKRAEPAPEELSKTSALNSRYNTALGGAAATPKGAADMTSSGVEVRQKPAGQFSRNSGSHQPLPTPAFRSSYAAAQQGRPAQVRTPMRAPGGQDMDLVVDSLFNGIVDDDMRDMNDSWAMENRIRGGGDTATAQQQSPMLFGMKGLQQYPLVPPLGFMSPPAGGIIDPTLLHQQLYYQQLQQQQQTVQLQAELQAKQLENQVLQSQLQGELLKQQLQQLKGQPTSSPAKSTAGTPTAVPASPRPSQSKKTPPPVKPKTVSVDKVNQNGVSDIFPPPPPPLVLSGAPSTAPQQTTPATVNNSPANKTKDGIEVVKATPAGGVYRKPPSKIGQIKWPPVSSKDEEEEPQQKITPGKLLIDETTEEQEKIAPKQTPEEIQRKINEKIKASQEKAAAEEEKNRIKSPPPAVLPKRKPPAQQQEHQPIPATHSNHHDNGEDEVFDEVVSSSTMDMKTRQAVLEKQLTSASWGTQAPRQRKPTVPAAPPMPNFDPPATAPETVPQATSPFLRPPTPQKMEVEKAYDIHSMDHIHTVVHAQPTDQFYTYNRVPWTLDIRKEVFTPLEKLDNPLAVHLIFAQIVRDVFSSDCVRLGNEERRNIQAVLDKQGVHQRNVLANHSAEAKMKVIEAAKQAPFYFCRMFPVNGGSQYRNLHIVGVSHSGIRLITRFKDIYEDHFDLIDHFKFEDLWEISVVKPITVLMRFAKKNVVVYSYLAPNICSLIKSYQSEVTKPVTRLH